jgi:hypothetical protein
LPKPGCCGRMAIMISNEMKLEDIRRDDAYDFSYPRCPQRYVAIEAKFPGLPLLIVDKEKRLVWGHDYLRLLLGRGGKKAIVWAADIAPGAALFLNFNLSDRLFGLNLYEKLLFVRKISVFCPAVEVQRRAGLDFSLNDVLLESLEALLDVSLRQVLAAGQLGLKAALRLIGFSVPDQRALLRLFMKVRFSESHQLQVMQLAEEIAFREKKSLPRVLAALRLSHWLKLEMPQHKIMDALNRRRYPAYSHCQDEWRQWQKQKAVPGRIALSHAPFFASEEVQILLSAKNRSEADELLQKLK